MTTEHVSVPREWLERLSKLDWFNAPKGAAAEICVMAQTMLQHHDMILSRATPSDNRGESWEVRFICCGRDDGNTIVNSYTEADAIRESYTSGVGVNPHGYSEAHEHDGGHQRAAIVSRFSTSPKDTSAPRVVTEPLSVFSGGMWTWNETGQSFTKAEMDEAAFIVYRDHAESFATSLPAARVPDGNDVCGELVSFIQVGEVARDGDIGRVTMYLPYSFIGRTVYLYDHAYRYQTDNSCTHGETYWKNRAHAAEDKIASQPLMDVCRQCDECAPYLKKDETPAQRIERERKDVTACLRLLQIERKLTDIDRLVDRFLAWPLPPSVCPDGCVMDSSYPHRIGTHLLTAEEAKAMFIHALGRDELLEADHKTGEKA